MVRKPSPTSTAKAEPFDPVFDYAQKVLSGEIVAGPWVRAACQRHMDDLDRDDIYFDLEAAQFFIDFCAYELRLTGGKFEGKPFILDAWQAFIGGSTFGWKWSDTGLRRFKYAYVETGKGSGKTPLAAAIGHYMLMVDGEARPEVYVAASSKDQAETMFRDVVAMYEQSPGLSERLLSRGQPPNVTQLTYLAEGGIIKPLSREAAGKSGRRTSCGLVDEVHEHPDGDVIDMLEADFKFRDEPLLFMITNSGSDPKTVCGEYHENGIKVVTGEVLEDESFFYICALDEDDDPWNDETCWPKANPSLGITIQYSYIRSRVEKARNIPSKRPKVERLNFCMWTEEAGGWIAKRVWKKIQCDFDYRDYAGRKAWIALDLSKARDLTSGTVVIEDGETVVTREDEDGEEVDLVEPCFVSFNVFWMPKDNLREREDETKAPYTRWANITKDDPDYGEKQYLTLTPGAAVKMAFVAHWLKAMSEIFDLQHVAFDEYRMDVLQNELDEINLDLPLVPHPQGFRRSAESGLWMPSSIEKMEECVLEERLRVCENPILTWNIAGVYMEESPEGNQKFHKRKSKNKIDGAVSHAMAIGLATNPPTDEKQDSYLNSGEVAIV